MRSSPTGSFTDPEYGSVGLTEEQARSRYDCAVAVARYEDMLRPVADGQPEGFCKLIVETARRQIIGAHVLGEYSAEVIQMVAACMAARMRVEDVAELQFAFPTFTEGVSQAAQMVVNQLGVRPMPRSLEQSEVHAVGPGMIGDAELVNPLYDPPVRPPSDEQHQPRAATRAFVPATIASSWVCESGANSAAICAVVAASAAAF